MFKKPQWQNCLLQAPGPLASPKNIFIFPWFLHGFLMKPQTQSKQEITEHKFANPERVKVAKSKVFPLILPILPKQTNEPKKTKNQKNKKKTKKNKIAHPNPLHLTPSPWGVQSWFFWFFGFLVFWYVWFFGFCFFCVFFFFNGLDMGGHCTCAK